MAKTDRPSSERSSTAKRADKDEQGRIRARDVEADASKRHGPAADDDSDTDGDAEADDDSDEFLAAELVEEEATPEAQPPEVLPVLAEPSGLASRRDSLARHDPLQAYMRDVQRYPLLKPEEEREAAVRYAETGDLQAAARLVTANLRLVVKIAYSYRRAYKNLMDLIQEGNIGLMQAVKKYDPYKGVKLSTYAAWWIRAYILRFVLNNSRLVKLGTTQAQRKLFFNLRKEKARLSAMGIEPTPEIISQNLQVPTEEVVQMDRRLSSGELSLDAPVSWSEGGASRVDLLPSRGLAADEALAGDEIQELTREKIHEFGETLEGKEAKIFHERLLADEPRTLQELGDEFGVSRERVRQIEKRVQQKLKKYLGDELGHEMFEPQH